MASIFRITEFDLLATKITNGSYFYCTDSKNLYRDLNNKRASMKFNPVDTEIDRLYNVKPSTGSLYYVYETNMLFLYNAGWTVVAGEASNVNGYYYLNNNIGTISGDVKDNNGLLGDGSVVIRDNNRVIKGRAYIDQSNNNLVISSFLGGGLTFLPDGGVEGKGKLTISAVKNYNGVDDLGNQIVTDSYGKMTFDGDIYIRNSSGDEDRLVTMKEVANYLTSIGLIETV